MQALAALQRLLEPPPQPPHLLAAHAAGVGMISGRDMERRARREKALFELKTEVLPALGQGEFDIMAARIAQDVSLETPSETLSVYLAVLELLLPPGSQ